jgi:hypothetical protein
MKTFSKILIAILVLLIVGVGCLFFFLSPIPYYFYNSVINPSGIVGKNTLISYGNFDVSSVFVDKINFENLMSKESQKIASIFIKGKNGASIYDYPDVRGCIANKDGDLLYGIELCMNECDNLRNLNFEIKSSTASITNDYTLDVFASLDGYKYYKEGGYSDTDYNDSNFLSNNLSSIIIYPMAYYKTSKGNMPHTCGDFYKNKSKPIKVIKLLK